MSKISELVFPDHCPNTCGCDHEAKPLTKRELFAATAMQGMVVVPGPPSWVSYAQVAEKAVAHADALPAALDRERE